MAKAAGLDFINYQISKVILDRTDIVVKEGEFEVNLRHLTQINKEDNKLFRTIIIIDIKGKNNPFSLQVQAVGNFKILGDISKAVEFNYLNISSPSIVYPYVRAFISNITLQAGMNPITIPPVNFAAKLQSKDAPPKKITPKKTAPKKAIPKKDL